MAMKKAEMERHCNQYFALMEEVRALLDKGFIRSAVQTAFKAWDFVDGMMQYARRYQDQEFDSIAAIEIVLIYSPFAFDAESLDRLEELLKSYRRIEKNTETCLADRLVEARAIMWDAHRLWNHIETNPGLYQDSLQETLGGNQDNWNCIAENWENMGLLSRQKEGRSYRLDFLTRMGSIITGKCPSCGKEERAPKSMLLEETTCPHCDQKVHFVFLSN